MTNRIALLALALCLPLAACGDAEDPTVVTDETITIETPDVDGAMDDAGAAMDDAADDMGAAADDAADTMGDAADDAGAAMGDAADDAAATMDEAGEEMEEEMTTEVE